MDGHPASSKWTLFEAFAQNIIQLAQSNRQQWAQTAIFVTVDEGGGYYDSGFIQPVDFFGTGPRIPMSAVSPTPRAAISATLTASIRRSLNSSSATGKYIRR